MQMTDRSLSDYASRRKWRDATLARVRGLGAESERAVARLIESLRVGDNQMRDLLDLLEDAAARRQVAVAEILADEEVEAVHRRKLGGSDKIKELKACLKRLRYPQLSAALARVEELRGALGLPRGVELQLPENLEGEEVVVTLRAASLVQLRARATALVNACARSELESIFSIWEESEG